MNAVITDEDLVEAAADFLDACTDYVADVNKVPEVGPDAATDWPVFARYLRTRNRLRVLLRLRRGARVRL